MTVSNQTNRTSAEGNGEIGQEVAFEFPISATSDLKVYKRVTLTGVQTDLVEGEGANYTVVIDGDSGGTLTTVTAIETTEQIHIVRNTPYTQTLDLEAGGPFNAENIEDAVDKNTKLAIQEKDAKARMLKFPETDPTSSIDDLPNSIDRAGKFLYFGADGTPAAAAGVTEDDVVVSDYMEDVVDKSSEANLKAKINLEIGTDVQAYNAKLAAIAALAVTNSNFIVGNGTTFVAESGATARTSLGAAADADVTKKDGSVAYTGTGAGFRDEDDFSSDDATAPASQQSAKAYADNSQKNQCRMYLGTEQSNIADNTPTIVEIDTDDYDPDNISNTGTYKITPNQAGYYLIVAQVGWLSDSVVADKNYAAQIYKNTTLITSDISHASNVKGLTNLVTTVVSLNGSTDYVQMKAISQSGGDTVDIEEGKSKTYLLVARIG